MNSDFQDTEAQDILAGLGDNIELPTGDEVKPDIILDDSSDNDQPEVDGVKSDDKPADEQNEDSITITLNGEESEAKADKPDEGVDDKKVDLTPKLQERFGLDAEGIDKMLSENKTLKEKAETSQYKTKLGEKLDDLIEKGVDPGYAAKILGTDPEKLTPRELIEFKMKVDHPELTGEEVNDLIDDEYSQIEDRTEKEKSVGNAKMKMKASEIRKEFDGLRDGALETDVDKKAKIFADREAVRVEKWTSVTPSIVKNFKGVEIDLGSGKMTYSVPKDQAETIQKEVDYYVDKSGLKLNEEGIGVVKQMMHDRFVAKNFALIAKAVATKARGMNTESWHKLVHNPSSLGQKNKQAQQQQKTTSDEGIMKHVMEQEGLL